jgi:D-arabinose 1-dehydrogenase-like Zn-dependent alcohol dehydrogenase
MPKMHAAQVTRPGGPFEIVEREIPQPAAGQVRVKVQACGICHSDSLAFSVLSGIRSMNEASPLEKVAEVYERMESGKARFRVVLTTRQ